MRSRRGSICTAATRQPPRALEASARRDVPARAHRALHATGIDAVTIIEVGLAVSADPRVLVHAVTENRAVVTENVGDFIAIAAQHSTTGAHHPGLLVALSSRFSRRASGHGEIIAALQAHRREDLTDRIVYLEAPAR